MLFAGLITLGVAIMGILNFWVPGAANPFDYAEPFEGMLLALSLGVFVLAVILIGMGVSEAIKRAADGD